MRFLIVLALIGGVAGPAIAQTTAPADTPPSAAADPARPGGCPEPSGVAEAATPPAPGADSTAPGNSGTTGWTGGTGGSQIGTNTAGAVAESRTVQPPTARGLDLMGAPEAADC